MEAAAKAAATGVVETTGIWSHFVYADSPGHPTTARQIERFGDALEVARRLGVVPEVRHLANSAATVTLPQAHFDLVRPGRCGLRPVAGAEQGSFGLTPAMTLRSRLANVKRVPAGEGVSYGHQYVLDADSTLALVPLGYADGVPRAATNSARCRINGRRTRSAAGSAWISSWSTCATTAAEGDEVLLFGPGTDGEPTAQDWANALDTIHYEVVSRIGARVPRTCERDLRSHRPAVERMRIGRCRPSSAARPACSARRPPRPASPSNARSVAADRAQINPRSAANLTATRTDRECRVPTDDGVSLYAEEVGPADAPLTVLFVHGYALNLNSFVLQRQAILDRASATGSGWCSTTCARTDAPGTPRPRAARSSSSAATCTASSTGWCRPARSC